MSKCAGETGKLRGQGLGGRHDGRDGHEEGTSVWVGDQVVLGVRTQVGKVKCFCCL